MKWIALALPCLLATAPSYASLAYSKDNKDSDKVSTNVQKYHFRLTKGMGTPVCEAYLQRLNTTRYQTPPFCDRAEQPTDPGFAGLNRVPLSVDAVHTLLPRVLGFMQSQIQGSTEGDAQMNAWRKARGLAPAGESMRGVKSLLSGGEIRVWRYDPPVDIDNDGTPEPIVVWQGYGLGSPLGVCGKPTAYGGFMSNGAQPQVPFVLNDAHNRIDEKKTTEIFGHPAGGYHLSNGETATAFRPIGFKMGIFQYRDTYYFDTFFDLWGDFQNKRKNDPALENTLGVFLRKHGKTQQVCEYYMTEGNEGATADNH